MEKHGAYYKFMRQNINGATLQTKYFSAFMSGFVHHSKFTDFNKNPLFYLVPLEKLEKFTAICQKKKTILNFSRTCRAF